MLEIGMALKCLANQPNASLPSRNEALHVFADQIGFDVDFITNPAAAQISVL
jgi:hypothetical protein